MSTIRTDPSGRRLRPRCSWRLFRPNLSHGTHSHPASWLSLCLIRCRPVPFTTDRPEHTRAVHGRSRPPVHAGQQSWKACWVQALASSNLASSARHLPADGPAGSQGTSASGTAVAHRCPKGRTAVSHRCSRARRTIGPPGRPKAQTAPTARPPHISPEAQPSTQAAKPPEPHAEAERRCLLVARYSPGRLQLRIVAGTSQGHTGSRIERTRNGRSPYTSAGDLQTGRRGTPLP